MKNKFVLSALAVFVLMIALSFVLSPSIAEKTAEKSAVAGVDSEKIQVLMYKSPSCGCCGAYASYLKAQKYSLEIREQDDLSDIKEQYGIPQEMFSCHTMVIEGYALEGHIPHAAIEKLLSEKPDISGIALPGMPTGSPGMPGLQSEPLIIYAFDEAGQTSEFMRL